MAKDGSRYTPQVNFRWREGMSPVQLKRNLAKFEENTMEDISTMIIDAANEMVDYIQVNWSGKYPPASSPGFPPAERTGNLDESVGKAISEARRSDIRDVYGRFATRKNALNVTIKVDTLLGTKLDKKRSYAHFLEHGTDFMEPRPFIAPAVRHVTMKFPELSRKLIQRSRRRKYV